MTRLFVSIFFFNNVILAILRNVYSGRLTFLYLPPIYVGVYKYMLPPIYVLKVQYNAKMFWLFEKLRYVALIKSDIIICTRNLKSIIAFYYT